MLALGVVVGLAILLALAWGVIRFKFLTRALPSLVSLATKARRREKGTPRFRAGMVAVGSGDMRAASRHAAGGAPNFWRRAAGQIAARESGAARRRPRRRGRRVPRDARSSANPCAGIARPAYRGPIASGRRRRRRRRRRHRFVLYSPLGRGILTGGIRKVEDLAPGDSRVQRFPRFQGENFAKNLVVADVVAKVASGRGVKPAQVALAWCLAEARTWCPSQAPNDANISKRTRPQSRSSCRPPICRFSTRPARQWASATPTCAPSMSKGVVQVLHPSHAIGVRV